MQKHSYDFMGKGYDYIKSVARLLGTDYEHEQYEQSVSFVHQSGKRFFQLIDDSEQLIISFDVPVPNLHKNNPVEVIHHHESPTHQHEWVFKTSTVEEIYAMIEIALINFHKSLQS